jgi:hypothetical protein
MFFITCSDPTSMREHKGVVYIKWSNLVVVVIMTAISCSAMVFTNSVVTSLGRKRMHVLYFLVTAENPKLTFIGLSIVILC